MRCTKQVVSQALVKRALSERSEAEDVTLMEIFGLINARCGDFVENKILSTRVLEAKG